jgi:glucose-6-phosphate isomerase
VSVTVTTAGAAAAVGVPVLERLVADRAASRTAGQDASLWGQAAAPEAATRLGWVDLPRSSVELLPRLAELSEAARARGLNRVVLCGMGGSSLAPEVITANAGVELTVLDSTDPQQVRAALGHRLDRSIVVVSSKSGGTVETDSQLRAFEHAFAETGLAGEDLAARFVVVTDPNSPLETSARKKGYAVVLADPHVGGRYSALTAFGLVPSALAGVDVGALLEDARSVGAVCAADTADNPALTLAATLGAAHEAGRDKVVIATAGPGVLGFGDWAEQLIAESTGKQGRGLLPVVVESPQAPGYADAGDDATPVLVSGASAGDPAGVHGVAVTGPLGAQFLVWEFATALVGRVLEINPFDQPNVEEAKKAARSQLEGANGARSAEPGGAAPAFVDGAVAVHATPDLLGGARTLADALDRLFAAVPDRGYLAVTAYLDRGGDAQAAALRPALARRTGRQVTFGWGPRFLHSTGQYHKGGHPNGHFLQITADAGEDLPVPGQPFSFGSLIAAQAAGDLAVLRGKGYPVLRLHLRGQRDEGLHQLLRAVDAGAVDAP